VKAGESDQLFGSVTSMDITEALEAKGFSIDRRKVELAEPIRTLGEYTVPVRIHREVAASVKLQVVREEGEQEGQAGQEEQKEKE
ncbi:MAG: 50S ribosomal protein L9, partial [Candidatus Acidiferrales bacterium]